MGGPGSDLLLACCSFPHCRNFIPTRGRQVAVLLSLLASQKPFFVIYIFAFALSLRFILPLPLPQPASFWPSFCFAFAFGFLLFVRSLDPSSAHLPLGIWTRWSLGSSPLNVCVLCACLPKSGLFIYLCFDGTEKKGHWKVLLFSYFASRV